MVVFPMPSSPTIPSVLTFLFKSIDHILILVLELTFPTNSVVINLYSMVPLLASRTSPEPEPSACLRVMRLCTSSSSIFTHFPSQALKRNLNTKFLLSASSSLILLHTNQLPPFASEGIQTLLKIAFEISPIRKIADEVKYLLSGFYELPYGVCLRLRFRFRFPFRFQIIGSSSNCKQD
ncbi:hypothetical protein V2J09_007384 [Rumex salicifolius]